MIDYKIISDSIIYYNELGFNRIETPWTVSKEIDEITKPSDRISLQLKHNDKCLVASGEQSFLYLYLKNFLPLGQFQTVTPCFRYESFDFLHLKYFIKNELIKTDVVNYNELLKIIDSCFGFYKTLFPEESLRVISVNNGFDIEINENELGSYGIRECKFLKWIYGTGCAEPRTSNLIKAYGLSQE